MASSRIEDYKASSRVDPRIKRRLRRSEEWQFKRDAEVNKLRNMGPMSPCRELDVDLSIDSSMCEATETSSPPQTSATITNNKTKTQPSTPKLPKDNVPSKVEAKIKQKKAATEAGKERYRMLQKWKEEKAILKKQEELERAKHKPFVVSTSCQGKSHFERSWEQHKKNIKKQPAVAATPSSRITRAGAATLSSSITRAGAATLSSSITRAGAATPSSRITRAGAASSQRTTRQTTSAAKQAAAPPTHAPATKVAPASRTAPATRATRATAASKKVPPKTVQAEPVRRSARASSKPDPKNLPSTKSKTTKNHKQTEAESTPFEEPLKEEEDVVVEAKNSATKNKTVSFAPGNFVFTTPEDLEPYDPWAFALSPASARSFLSNSDHIPVDLFRISNSPPSKDYVTVKRGHLFTDEIDASVIETRVPVQEDEKDSDVEKSHSSFLDKDVDVPSKTPEQNVEAEPVAEKNVSVNEQEAPAAPSEELSEKAPPLKTDTPVRVTRSSSFKTPVSGEPVTQKRKPRRSMSETRVKPAKQTRRRRKTETALIPQSPEEWVELLKSSPMIEMSRKKYRKERLSTVPLNLQFDDDDLIAANIIPSKDSSSSEADEKLPEQTPQKEVESSETIVAITESSSECIPEVKSDVSPVEPSVVEPSVDSQPEQMTTNTEDESVEKPIESSGKEMVSSEKIVSVTESLPEVESDVSPVEPSVVEPSVDSQPEQMTTNTEDESIEKPIESSGKEMVSSEKIVSVTESLPEVESDVSPVEPSVVEPSVDSQPEQMTTNTEDESVEKPIESSGKEMVSSEKIVSVTESLPEVESDVSPVEPSVVEPSVDSQPEQMTTNTEDESIEKPIESSGKEMVSSEKIVSVTESLPEVESDVSPVEPSVVEPSVDSQPEQMTTNTEDESVEKPIESSGKEMVSSEKIVSVTESLPEVESDVSPVEPSVVEPSVDSQPEQMTTNTEDESVEKPIESSGKEMVSSEKIVSVTESLPEVESDVSPVEPSVDSQPEQMTTNTEDESVEKPIESSGKEMVSSEKIVSVTESLPEVESDVSPVEPSVVEPSVDSQPEQMTTNTEDESVEKPIESSGKEMVSSEKIVSVTESTPEVESVKHDVAYFRNLIKSQTDSLNSFIDKFEGDVQDVNDEVEGQIRTVVGKTKLLINERFCQFIGLIDNCEYKTGEKEITCDDLQGFWDMVDFQVEDVLTQFEELKKLKENNWQPLESNLSPVKKLVKKVKPAAPKAKTERRGKSKFAMFMAQKKKEVKESSEPKVSSLNPQSKSTDSSLKVFDAGFFKVESPVKSPNPNYEEILKSPLVMPTFVETDRTVRLSPNITTITIGEEYKMDSPKKAGDPEKEPPQIEPKSPLSINVQSPIASPLLPSKSLRRSFLPAIPSPLLQDITPNKKDWRSQKSFVFTDIGSPKMTVRVPEQNPDEEPAEKIVVLQTPPPRRSGRARTPVASYSPRPNVNKTPSQSVVMQSFIKNMLSSESSLEGSQSPKDEEKATEYPPVFTPLEDGSAKKKSTPRQKSRRKTVEPQVTDAPPKRRRSARLSRRSLISYEEQTASDDKENATDISITIDLPPSSKRGNRKTKSVAFSQLSTVAIDDSPSTVLCLVSPNVETTEEQQEELIRKSGRFQSLKVGFTPVRSRPNLQCSPRTNIDIESDANLMYFTP